MENNVVDVPEKAEILTHANKEKELEIKGMEEEEMSGSGKVMNCPAVIVTRLF